MKSIKSVYKTGNGPSSSHTVGPYRAARLFRGEYPGADEYKVILYGSLAFTGEGHSTGKSIVSALPGAVVEFNKTETELPHPNTMDFIAYNNGTETGRMRILSIGGGSIKVVGADRDEDPEVYPEKNFAEIARSCEELNLSLKEFVYYREGGEIRDYLAEIWETMKDAVRRGLDAEGILPGGLELTRKAKELFNMRCYNESNDVTMNRIIASYAYAVSEENASENVVVTAPTCGSCGVIPAVMYYMHCDRGFPENEIIDALAVAGLFGNIIRTNASVSGAEAGCQAEIGSACSMAAAGLAALYGLSIKQTEYAAEIAMEHNLGLTCDPIKGLVQIPCIERNAVAAMRAISSVDLSRFLSETRTISFDEVVDTMYRTGLDMNVKYRETSHGGLAAIYQARTENRA